MMITTLLLTKLLNLIDDILNINPEIHENKPLNQLKKDNNQHSTIKLFIFLLVSLLLLFYRINMVKAFVDLKHKYKRMIETVGLFTQFAGYTLFHKKKIICHSGV